VRPTLTLNLVTANCTLWTLHTSLAARTAGARRGAGSAHAMHVVLRGCVWRTREPPSRACSHAVAARQAGRLMRARMLRARGRVRRPERAR